VPSLDHLRIRRPKPNDEAAVGKTSSVIAVIAGHRGRRACICMISRTELIVDVRAPTKREKVITSAPHASPDHTESKPAFRFQDHVNRLLPFVGPSIR